jgi:Glycosyl hydrolase family 57
MAKGSEEPPLYILTYDHGGAVLWGTKKFGESLRSAVAWLERYPSFKIGLDNEAYTYDFLAEHEPGLLNELRGYLKHFRGRLGVGTATYGQPLSCFINEESNVRQLEYARETDRRLLGAAPPVYVMSEHALHAQIPQLLRGFGIAGALVRTHFQMYGYNPTFDAPIGWWIGLDGSRVPAVPTYKGEGAEFGKTTEDNWILTRYPGPQCKESLEDFRRKFARINPLLASRVDDAGLRKEELVKECEGRPGYHWILLEELLGAFPAPQAELRTAPNDFLVRMPWGYCGNEIWNRCRQGEVAVLTAERLAALALMLEDTHAHARGDEGRESQLTRAWKNLLVAQHHDIQITGLVADARRFVGESLQASGEVVQSSLRHVAAQMSGGKIAQVTVFNPHSWPRKEWVEVEVPLPSDAGLPVGAERDAKPVPSYVISPSPQAGGDVTAGRAQETSSARVAILADVPGLACAAYAIAATPWNSAVGPEVDEDHLTIRAPLWTLRLDPQGGVAEWRVRRNGRPVLRPGSRAGFFAGRIENRDCESRGKWSFLPRPTGAPSVTAREKGEIGGIPYVFDLTVSCDSPRLDCHAAFQFANQRIGQVSDDVRDRHSGFVHEDKLRFKVLPNFSGGITGVRDVPFGVAETDDRYVQGIYWTALTDGRNGMAFFNRGAMGSVREQDGGFSMVLAFAMYYVWRTVMLKGTYTYDFSLWPFAGAWQEADLHRRALEYNFPLVAIGSEPGSGRLGSLAQPVEADSDGAIITALFPRDGIPHLRLFEYRGTPAIVKLRGPSRRFTEVDLAGHPKGLLSSPLALSPWQIRTVRIARRDSQS